TAAPQPTAEPAPTTPPAAQKGGKLTILYWQAVTTLNPHLATGTKDFDGATVILEPLARYNEKDELVPFLAAEIPTIANGGVAADGTSVTWKLKPGVKWSDGTDFTAEDVIFTWQYCADPATACTTKAVFDPIDRIEKIDDTTIKIIWKQPTAYPYLPFVGPNGMILQQKQFGNCIGAAASTSAECQAANLAPIGTNAWKLREFRPGDTVIYERNPFYRDADKVFFDEVEIKGGGDATSAARAVCETGEVDFAWNLQIPKAVLEPILANGKCDPIAGGSFGVERIVVNFANPDPALGDKRSEPDQPHPFLTDPAVRRAISLAIDRKAIDDQLYGPTGEPTCNVLVVPSTVNSPNTKCDRDVAEANRILDEAGWVRKGQVREKDGVKLIVSFQTSINTLRQSAQAIIKSNLAEIGVQVNLKAIDASVFFGGDPGNPDTLNKFYADLQMYTNGPNSADPQQYLQGWICSEVKSSANQWRGGNDARYCNPEYDALFEQLKVELNPERRAELAIKMNDLLVNDVVVIPLINRQTPNAKLKNLEGPTFNTFDSNLWNIASWRRAP
ncbi:peptide ABC transporter substrate-binding protein, partial [Chloroflexus sp.]|uniref:peptide ABC transporter substrate-binding protein n=1 Tax=Chloroflexus sp. TaxID=1904827 RepID=UPI002ACD3592